MAATVLFKSKQQKFMDLYRPVHERFARYCDIKTNYTKEDSEDLINDTLLVAFEKFNTLRNEEAFLYFLFGTARNIWLNKNRRNKFSADYERSLEEKIHSSLISPDFSTEISLLYQKINLLNEEDADIITLKEISGFSVKEVAKIKSLSESNVKVRLHRSREKLKQMMSESKNKRYE